MVKNNSKLLLKVYFSIILFLMSGVCLLAQSNIIAEKNFDVKPGEELKVDAEGADINVWSWDKNTVEVKVYGNRRAEEKLEIEIEQTSRGVELNIEKRGGFFSGWFNSLSCRAEIRVPENYNIFVKTSGGDVSVEQITGRVELKTSGGDVNSANVKGNLKISTSGGDIIVKDQQGESDLSTSGGDIKGRSLEGNVDASTSGGDIELSVEKGKVEASTSGGDVVVEFNGVNEGIDLRTSGGDVSLNVRKDIKADVYLYASGGRVDCALDATKVYKESKRKFEGEINGGGEKIYCKTSGGDVEVR